MSSPHSESDDSKLKAFLDTRRSAEIARLLPIHHQASTFNTAFEKYYPGLWKVMNTYDDFSTLRGFVVIDICKRENIINQNVAKILFEKLEERNAPALRLHPARIKHGSLQDWLVSKAHSSTVRCSRDGGGEHE